MRILVVDDEKSIRDACHEILSKAGHEVETAKDGLEGRQKIQTNDYDLILLDLKMPGLGGLDLVETAIRRDPEIVIIIITGYATIETAVEAIKKGAYDYIPKPFTPDSLRILVNRGLEKRKLSLEALNLRKERERSLLEVAYERTQTRTIINCMTDGVLVVNREEQLVLYNPAALQMLEIKEKPLIGLPIGECIKNEKLVSLLNRMLKEKTEPHSFISEEITIDHGKQTVLMANIAPVHALDGETIGSVVLLRDITKLRELDKVKSDFISMVAHELKAPLAAIEGYLNIILGGIIDGEIEKQQIMLSRCRERAQSLMTLIKDLLDIASLEASTIAQHKEPVQLSNILKETIEFLSNEAKIRDVKIEHSIPSSLPSVNADKRDMERLFTNILSNAIKYNKQGGLVKVIAIDEGGFVKISISDTGIGIHKDALPRIFEEFYRVKDERTRNITGTGLGLSIVKKIIQSHFGQIEVKSEPGKGSTFTVFLPSLHG